MNLHRNHFLPIRCTQIEIGPWGPIFSSPVGARKNPLGKLQQKKISFDLEKNSLTFLVTQKWFQKVSTLKDYFFRYCAGAGSDNESAIFK
jgi:hypothetical protein